LTISSPGSPGATRAVIVDQRTSVPGHGMPIEPGVRPDSGLKLTSGELSVSP
jgi:hypothetical protein